MTTLGFRYKRWFAVTTQTADRVPKFFSFNTIGGRVIGVVFRLPDGEALNGTVSHHSLSLGRYARPVRVRNWEGGVA